MRTRSSFLFGTMMLLVGAGVACGEAAIGVAPEDADADGSTPSATATEPPFLPDGAPNPSARRCCITRKA